MFSMKTIEVSTSAF